MNPASPTGRRNGSRLAEDDPPSQEQLKRHRREAEREAAKADLSGDGGPDSPRRLSESGRAVQRVMSSRGIPRRITLTDALPESHSPRVGEAFNDYIRSQEVRGLSDSSIEQMGRVARHFVEVVGDDVTVHELSLTDVDDYIVTMRRRGNSPATINTNLQWLKDFLSWCDGKGRDDRGGLTGPCYVLSLNPDDVRTVQAPKTQKRIADPEAVRRLLASLDDSTFDGLRFRTTILLMLDTGVRAAEVCALNVDDIAGDGASIRVWGKGSRERTVYLSRDMTEALRRWTTYRSRAMEYARMEDNPVLFPSLTGNRQISVQIGDLFRSRCKLAGISPHITPHSLRHRWATEHVRKGTNAFLLRQIGGWSDMKIVMTYVSEVEGSAVRQANEKASLVGDLVGRRVPRRQEGKK